MAQEVQMPKLGQTMEEGTIERWLKKEGDQVEKGEPIFEVTTDKATLEVEAFASGTLLKIIVGEGETVPVNDVIAYIGEKGEEVPEGKQKSQEAPKAQPAEKAEEQKAEATEEKPEEKQEQPQTASSEGEGNYQAVTMPKLGQTMEEGTIERWLKKEGDDVEKGEPIFEVTTDKATLEVEAFSSGKLLKILVGDGETAPVNDVVAYIGEEGAKPPEGKPAAKEEPAKKEKPAAEEKAVQAEAKPQPAKPAATQQPAPAKPAQAEAPERPGLIKASPRAKKLAKAEKVPLAVLNGSGPGGRIIEEDVERYARSIREIKTTPTARELAYQNDIDLRKVEGSGPNGKITKEDVQTAAEKARPALEAGRVELTAMRKIVAQRMIESKQTVPHFYLFAEADMTNVIALRKQLNSQEGVKVSFNDIIIKACADAYVEVPRMNAEYAEDAVNMHASADIGLAVAIEDGLIVPIVRGVEGKDYVAISNDTKDLIERARNKKLGPDEYTGGSMTISNLGMYGIDNFIPIINPGQAAILGVGKIQERVVARDGGIHIRPMMQMTLCCDHRIVNGAEGAEYLGALKNILEKIGTE